MAKKVTKKSKKKQLRRKRSLRALSLALCLVIAVSLWIGLRNPSADVAALPSDIEDEGLLRVLLRSLGNPTELDIELDGIYTVDGDAGFRFAKGSSLSVSEDGGELYLTSGGLTINMGGSFTLKRHAPESGTDAGGLTIQQSEKQNLYAGDLLLSSTGSGIKSILTLQTEDYLKGVIAYEMNDSFPLEALKAQAIAARTYALRAKAGRAQYEYDVTDTTSDQVYKGYNASYTNVEKAVEETRGIVCMYGGSFAECLYTASNGGQTAAAEQIWGNAVSYLPMQEDPYDLQNLSSIVKSAEIPACPAEDSDLAQALTQKLAQDQGVSADTLRIDEIVSAETAEADREGSKMASAVRFGVNYSVLLTVPATAETDTQTEWTPVVTAVQETSTLTGELPDTYVSLSTYSCLKPLLGIGINSQDFEVFEIEETEGGFTLTARRFGHGVGMSQRGAQTMAGKYGKTCEEILDFYYPGTELYKISWTESSLTKLSELSSNSGYDRVKPTPCPTQAPLPELEQGQYIAVVTLQSSSSTLNVRSEASTLGDIVAFLYSGNKVIVTGEFEDDWVSIKTAEITGYVKADYLADMNGSPLVK